MQIHEITKLQQQLEEGILSGIKKAVSATKTGAVNAVKGAGNFGAALLEPQINFAKDAKQTAATGLKKGGGGMWKALTSNSALATAQQARDKKSSDKTLAALAKQGISPLNYYIKKAKEDPAAKQKRDALDSAFPKEFEIGYQLNPNAAQMHAQQQAARPPKSKLQQTIAAQNKQMSPQSGINEDNIELSPGGIAIPSATKSSTSKKAPANPMAEATVDQNKLSTMKTRARNAPVAQASPTATPTAPAKKNIQTDFTKWVSSALPNSAEAMEDPEVKQALNAQFKKVLAARENKKAATDAVDQYILLVQAGIAKVRDTGTADMSGDSASETQKSFIPTPANVISKMQQKGIKDTGDPEINQDLKYLKVPLKESQIEMHYLEQQLAQLMAKKY
jgi:hypothetical protein